MKLFGYLAWNLGQLLDAKIIRSGSNERVNQHRFLQHYLGHKNIQHTVRYTELTSKRFDKFWKD